MYIYTCMCIDFYRYLQPMYKVCMRIYMYSLYMYGQAKAIVVVDDRDCAAALALAEWCSSCDVVLCAAWELDGARCTCHYIYIHI